MGETVSDLASGDSTHATRAVPASTQSSTKSPWRAYTPGCTPHRTTRAKAPRVRIACAHLIDRTCLSGLDATACPSAAWAGAGACPVAFAYDLDDAAVELHGLFPAAENTDGERGGKSFELAFTSVSDWALDQNA